MPHQEEAQATHTIWVPGRLPGLNEFIAARGRRRGRWDPYARLKREWSIVVGMVARGRIPNGAHWTYFHVEPNRRRDPSNFCAGAQKIIEDALQEAGKLEGDGWRHIGGFSHHWTVGDPPGCLVLVGPNAVSREECLDVVARLRLSRVV